MMSQCKPIEERNPFISFSAPVEAPTTPPKEPEREVIPPQLDESGPLEVEEVASVDEQSVVDQAEAVSAIDVLVDDILDDIRTGEGMVDPSDAATESALFAFDDTLATHTNQTLYDLAVAQGISNPSLPSPPSLSLLQQLLDALESARDQILEFRNLSRMLSGKYLGGAMNLINVMNLLIASRRNGYPGCDMTSGVFSIITDASLWVAKLNKIQNDLYKFLTNITASYQQFYADVVNLKNEITQVITSTLAKIAETQLLALQNMLARGMEGLFDDPCFGSMFTNITSPIIKAKVNQIKRFRVSV